MSAIPKKVREAVLTRAGGRCEGCGKSAPLELHHRRFRSRGGEHTVENIVGLCGGDGGMFGGNHSGCHGIAHSSAPSPGWAVSRWGTDPLHIPFLSHRGLVFLTRDGRYVDASDPDF